MSDASRELTTYEMIIAQLKGQRISTEMDLLLKQLSYTIDQQMILLDKLTKQYSRLGDEGAESMAIMEERIEWAMKNGFETIEGYGARK